MWLCCTRPARAWQVLELVHYLVTYGFYTERDKLNALLEPLMSLLDGTNDLPYPMLNSECAPARTVGRKL